MVLFGGISFNGQQRNQIGVFERVANPLATNVNLSNKIKSEMKVMMPAKVVSWNAATQTITAQPLIMDKILDKATGNISLIPYPVLNDVPVCFPQAGPFVLTMPIAAGDEVVLIFADMCIDSWWDKGDQQGWNTKRRHDLSDAIAVIGINSKPNVTQSIATDAAELRTKTAGHKIALKEDAISIDANGKKIDIDSDEVKITYSSGNTITLDNTKAEMKIGSSKVEVQGGEINLSSGTINITGVLNINSAPYLTHTHSGVSTGAGITGPINTV